VNSLSLCQLNLRSYRNVCSSVNGKFYDVRFWNRQSPSGLEIMVCETCFRGFQEPSTLRSDHTWWSCGWEYEIAGTYIQLSAERCLFCRIIQKGLHRLSGADHLSPKVRLKYVLQGSSKDAGFATASVVAHHELGPSFSTYFLIENIAAAGTPTPLHR
jgi:hypothetical protein